MSSPLSSPHSFSRQWTWTTLAGRISMKVCLLPPSIAGLNICIEPLRWKHRLACTRLEAAASPQEQPARIAGCCDFCRNARPHAFCGKNMLLVILECSTQFCARGHTQSSESDELVPHQTRLDNSLQWLPNSMLKRNQGCLACRAGSSAWL